MIYSFITHRSRSTLFILLLAASIYRPLFAQISSINVVVLVKDKESNTILTEVELRMKDLKTGKIFTPLFNNEKKTFSIQVTPETTVSIYGVAKGYTDASINIHDIKYDRLVDLELSKIKKANLNISALDVAGGRPIRTASVKVTYKTPVVSSQTYSLKTGKLQLEIFDGPYTVEMTALAPGYTSASKNLTIETAAGEGKTYEFEARLERIRAPKSVISASEKPVTEKKKGDSSFGNLEKGKVIVLNNIYFDQSSPVLRAESSPQLDELVEVLKQNPAVRVEIRGHTDNVGDFELNIKLSRDRCQSVVDYLIQKGIAANRLQTVGRGPVDAVAPNTTEENRKKNRRVEFIVL